MIPHKINVRNVINRSLEKHIFLVKLSGSLFCWIVPILAANTQNLIAGKNYEVFKAARATV
jgi:hypothetical protein